MFQISMKTIDFPNTKETISYTEKTLILNISYHSALPVDQKSTRVFNQWRTASQPPRLIIIRPRLDAPNFNTSEGILDDYRQNISLLASNLDNLGSKTLWLEIDPVTSYPQNEVISTFNDVIRESLSDTNVQVWNNTRNNLNN